MDYDVMNLEVSDFRDRDVWLTRDQCQLKIGCQQWSRWRHPISSACPEPQSYLVRPPTTLM